MGLLLNVAGGGSTQLRRCRSHARGSRVNAPPEDRDRSRRDTAGHVVPAIAVADALRAEGAEVTFVGGERAEAELVPKAGYELDTLNVEGLSRTNPLKAARALGKAGAAVVQARKILKRREADAVLGGGGYVAGPVGLAATPEQGPARARRGRQPPRHLQPRAREPRPPRLPRVPAGGTHGRPLPRHRPPGTAQGHRPRARTRAARDRRRTRRACSCSAARSARARSTRRRSAFKDAPYRVVHVAGTRDYPTLTSPGAHYVLLDYLTPFGIALVAADVAVGRSGGSVFELAQYGLPSVLIPYPHASADHQSSNARWMADAGAARILTDAELTPRAAARGDRRGARRSAARCHRRRCRWRCRTPRTTSHTRSSPRLQAKKFIPPSDGEARAGM